MDQETSSANSARGSQVKQARLRLLELAVSHSVDELLTATLDELEALTGSTTGFYHVLAADQTTLALRNWSTNTLATMCTISGKGTDCDIAQAGVWADCVREGRPVIHNDYASLPYRRGLPDGHAVGVREAVVPVLRGNLTRAIVGVGNKPTDYDQADIEVISQLADLSWDIVERREAEEFLAESEEFLRVTLENILDPVFITDDEGKFTFICANVVHVLGYTPEEISALGRIAKLFGRELFDLAELETKGEIRDIECVITRRDGAERDFLVTVKRVSIREGTVLYVCHDITERHEAEARLRDSEERMRLAFEIGQIGLWDWDVTNDVWYASPTYYTALGYEPRQGTGDRSEWLARVHPDDRAEVEAKIREVLTRDSRSYEYEARMCHADGTYRWVRVAGFGVARDPSGQVTRLLGTRMDIDERKRAEEALKRSEEEKTILNQIAKIFLTVSGEEMYGEVLAVVLRVMESKLGVFGYVGEDGDLVALSLTGEIWDECRHPGRSFVFSRDTWGDSLWSKALGECKSFRSAGPFHTPAGHTRVDHFLMVPVIYAMGSIGLLSVANKDAGYTEEDQELLERIAENISPILHARLQGEIQERKREEAERSLSESEEKYRLLIDNAYEAIFIVQDEVMKFANPRAVELTGRSVEELAKTSFIDLVHSEDRLGISEWFAGHREEGQHFGVRPMRMVERNGFGPWVQIRTVPIVWESRPGLLCFLSDVTEEKRLDD